MEEQLIVINEYRIPIIACSLMFLFNSNRLYKSKGSHYRELFIWVFRLLNDCFIWIYRDSSIQLTYSQGSTPTCFWIQEILTTPAFWYSFLVINREWQSIVIISQKFLWPEAQCVRYLSKPSHCLFSNCLLFILLLF